MEVLNNPVKYHVTHTFTREFNASECHSMALASCRIACRSAEVVRGRINAEQLRRAMTRPCIEKLQMMQHLVTTQMHADPLLKARLSYLPVIPAVVNVMLIAQDTMEVAVVMTIGRDVFLMNLQFR